MPSPPSALPPAYPGGFSVPHAHPGEAAHVDSSSPIAEATVRVQDRRTLVIGLRRRLLANRRRRLSATASVIWGLWGGCQHVIIQVNLICIVELRVLRDEGLAKVGLQTFHWVHSHSTLLRIHSQILHKRTYKTSLFYSKKLGKNNFLLKTISLNYASVGFSLKTLLVVCNVSSFSQL